MRGLGLIVLAVVLSALAPANALPEGWSWEWELSLLPIADDWNFANPTAINNRGWVVGHGGPSSGTRRPVLWRDGSYVDLLEAYPGAESYVIGAARTINNRGWVGGDVNQPGGLPQAILWDTNRGEAHVVHPAAEDVPDWEFTMSAVQDVNDRGFAVGWLRNLQPAPVGFRGDRAYVWHRYGRAGELLPLPDDYLFSLAVDVNNRGVVCGSLFEVSPFSAIEACVWLPSRFCGYEVVNIHTLLQAEYPEIGRSFASTVDAWGRVFGWAQTDAFERRWSWVWEKGRGVRFLDTDGSVGSIQGGERRFQTGNTDDAGQGEEDALAWIRLMPEVLPRLPGYGGHLGAAVNVHGVIAGYALHEGNDVWWQGSDPWIARRTLKRD